MHYEEAVHYIHARLKFGIRPGLERMERMLEELGRPQERTQFVHVAGTNGKGSCSAMLSCILQAAGYKTGLFTSPYVTDFRERIQIGGEMIPREHLAQAVERLRPIIQTLEAGDNAPTEFEVITALALDYFVRMGCEVVVLETGLGGRLDSTNIIPPPLCGVIMSISYDHMDILGGTLEEITAEKCGILKPGSRTVSYPKQPDCVLPIIRQAAQERNNSLYLPDTGALELSRQSLEGTRFTYRGKPYHIRMLGAHQAYNAVTVLECVRALRDAGLHLPEDAVRRGLESAALPARMELLQDVPPVLLDGGHNPGCAESLLALLQTLFSGKRILCIAGMMRDKDYEGYLRTLSPVLSHLYTVTPDQPRALPAADLARCAAGFLPEATACASVEQAVGLARREQDAADLLLICGSFYLAGEARTLFE
ncbi:MAG: bifunctional folylpolyglutamate synthase/dihydrofolate synthase [Clostridiales bacterium]|nr:bifunctional folylpolyglutamate synthase/dihydrofolate synthase [Clostridiales bacterium]